MSISDLTPATFGGRTQLDLAYSGVNLVYARPRAVFLQG